MDAPDYSQTLVAGYSEPQRVAYDGAQVVIPPAAITETTTIGISDLSGIATASTPGEVPRLDPGMTDVTGSSHDGFEFTPHPMTFAADIELTMPYDPALLEEGFTAQDIYTYFYDDVALCWRELRRESVDEVNHTVTSWTNHFTDFINSTVTAPEHPENVSFNPNQIKGIQAADPGTGITLIAPPQPNNQGDNTLSYPIQVPPGRLGVQPSLAVTYNSSGANGWLGVGWNLMTPTISVDTRFGVPRYDTATETETYLLNGEQLTPVANREQAAPRTAEKVFHTRVEGNFARIVRHGDGPTKYTWEIVDKAGTRSFYGALPGATGPESNATLADGKGDVFLWALREVRDVHGNVMRFGYASVADAGGLSPGPDGNEPGRNIYPNKITYSGSEDAEGKYAVTFVRDRDLGEPLRADVSIDARGGFKRVTADLLRRVEVSFDGGLVRRYELAYTKGAFDKTLLHSITESDGHGTVAGTHEFSYFDEIHAADGLYQAFHSQDWMVPGDDLGNGLLNLAPGSPGDASVLGSNSSIEAGAHLYLGGSLTPGKPGSVGIKVGGSHTSNTGVVALVDVDGDNLPDKVIRKDDKVFYHKNLSGPHGEPRFDDHAVELNLPGIGAETTNTLTEGLEGYDGPVAAQLDHVGSSTTTSQYFADVNGDGIADLVDGTNVLFGRIGPDNVPVYGISENTPVPVKGGHPDTTRLLADLGAQLQQLRAAHPLLDSVRRWIAPFDGVVAITGAVQLTHPGPAPADGVRVAIQKGGDELWSQRIGGQDGAAHTPTGVDEVSVSKGTAIYFRVGSVDDGSADEVAWDPTVTYQDVDVDRVDANGKPVFAYQASADFSLGGFDAPLTVPLTGTIHLRGDLSTSSPLTDDVTATVTRDGTPVLSHTVPAGAAGTAAVDLDLDVQKGQVLTWRVAVDSPVDVGKISWTPEFFYTSAEGIATVTDTAGKPLIDVFPTYGVDMYPVDEQSEPQGFYEAPGDGTVDVDATLNLHFNNDPPGSGPSGRVAFTVKHPGGLVSKRFFAFTRGAGGGIDQQTLEVHKGDRLYFDFSTRDSQLVTQAISPPEHTVAVTFTPKDGGPVQDQPAGGDGDPQPGQQAVSAPLHSAAVNGADLFPQLFRGWSVIGYNGDGDRADTAIDQSRLVFNDDDKDDLPDEVDPQKEKDAFRANPTVKVPKVVPLAPSTKEHRFGFGDVWVSANGAGSSRLGAQTLPSLGDFDGGLAVPRQSSSSQISLTGELHPPVVSVGGSTTIDGHSSGDVDSVDMNGDGFPDVVTSGGIQYSSPAGGLGDRHGDWPDGESSEVRSSATASSNANAGAAARTTSDGEGDPAPTGESSADTAQAGNDMVTLGAGGSASGSLGESTADGQVDLVDVNGDALPDRVYSDGTVRLNLGYSFGKREAWGNGGSINEASGSSTGINLGFNTGFYEFAGGAAFSQSTNSSRTSLADLNGDGLIDRVVAGTQITVAFNTGHGFATPVVLHGSLPQINTDENTTLGGGLYFTYPLCGLIALFCLDINPGVDGSFGVSRSTMALRDIDGDGFVDQLQSTSDGQLHVAHNDTGKTNLLQSVQRPLHGEIDFDYTRDGNTYGQPQSRFVLSRVSVDDKQPGDGADVQATTYEYNGGVYDRLEREFDGYASVVAHQVDPGAKDAVLRSVTREYRTDGHYTRGLLTRQLTTDGAGHLFLETDNAYSLRDVANPSGAADPASTTATIFAQLVRTDQKFFEGQSTPGKSTFTTLAYDSVGNVIESFDAGDEGPSDDVDTRMSYTAGDPACQAANIVGTPTTIDVFGGGRLMRHREATVDCTNGNVTQIRAALNSTDTAVTDLAYFSNGTLQTVINPANKSGQRYRLDYTYDDVVASHVATIVDSFGYRSSNTYNLKFGVVETTTDENNQVVRNTYDSIGRLSTVVGPYEAAESRATITFEYHPEATVPYAITRHVDRQADGTVRPDTIDTITFVDGLDRGIQTKIDAAVSTGPDTAPADDMVASGRVVFDALGRTVKTYFPVTEPKGSANTTFNPTFDSVQPTVTTFDVLDRVTKTTLPDNTTSTLTYGFGPDRAGVTQFEADSTDANGKTARRFSDVHQHITAIKQANPAGGHPVIWTSYSYDALGQLTATRDDQNNSTSTTYDNFGRRTSITSPDAGRTDLVYDLAGDLIDKVTAKLAGSQQAIEYDYDFTRLRAIRYPVFTANNVTYTYGAPGAANNAANRVVSVIDGAGSVTRQYGPLGEVTSETRTTTGQNNKPVSFTTQYQYDTWNRMLKLTYPDGEALSYHYDSGGQVDSAAGVKSGFTYNYLKRLDYDKFGQRVLLDTGNGTRTQYSYDSLNQRLKNLKANLAQGYVFQNLNYTYDDVGNITKIQNDTVAPSSPDVGMQVGGPSTQTFTYDDLNQLVHAEGSYQPRTPQTDTYSVDLTYDSISNITNKTQAHQLVSNGKTITDDKLSYTNAYGYTGGGPHQAVTIGGYTFSYDANGNQISRVQQSGPRQQMIWDEENRLACSHTNAPNTLPQTPASCDNAGGTPNDARYLYDDQGNRIVKDGAELHIYPNQNYSTRGNFAFKHVYIGQSKLVTKTVEKNRLEDQQFYSHDDQLGSVGFVTDASGGLAEHLQYMPGGETWVQEHPSQPVPQQYTGKELDPETGLYYYGARYYDPRTQQWQSPDPILGSYLDGGPNLGVYDPANLALYTYANNNPIRYNDPTGESWKDWAWVAVKVAAVVIVGVATAGLGAAIIAGGLAAGTTTGLLAATAVIAVDAYFAAKSASIALTGRDGDGNQYSTAERIANGVAVVASIAAPFVANRLARAAPEVEPAPRAAKPATSPCRSFDKNTPVLMADGTTKPIAGIEVGDKVLATDPGTGRTKSEPVTGLWVHNDRLIDLRLDSGGVVTTTANHLFWSVTEHKWKEVQDLYPGEQLLTANGAHVTVSRVVWNTAHTDDAYNLTVADIHTYYVVVGDVPVLVHNNDGPKKPPWLTGEKVDPSRLPTSDQAKLAAKKWAGIPLNGPGSEPVDVITNASGVQEVYQVDGRVMLLEESTLDSSHPGQPHWEAGPAKPNLQVDNYGRYRISNNKVRVFFRPGTPCG